MANRSRRWASDLLDFGRSSSPRSTPANPPERKLTLEELEPRIAPTIVWSGGSFTWVDPEDVYIRVNMEGGTPAPFPFAVPGSVEEAANFAIAATYVDVLSPLGLDIGAYLMGTTNLEGEIFQPGDVDWYSFTLQFNEDLNLNTILDPGEDVNGNGILDGAPVTIDVATPGGGGVNDFDVNIGLFNRDPITGVVQMIAYDDNSGAGDPNDAQIVYNMNNPAVDFTGRYYLGIACAPDGDPVNDPDLPSPAPPPGVLFDGSPVGDLLTGWGSYDLTIVNHAVPQPGTINEATYITTTPDAGDSLAAASDIDGPASGNPDYIGTISFYNSDLTTELTVMSGELDEDTGIFVWTPGALATSELWAGTDGPEGSGGARILGIGVGDEGIEALAVNGPDPDGPGPLLPTHQDVGRILIDGSLFDCGITVEGSVRDLYLGFMAYQSTGAFPVSVDILGDLQHMSINSNAGLLDGDPWLYDSDTVYRGPGVINVAGTFGEFQVAGFNCDYDVAVGVGTPLSQISTPFQEIERVNLLAPVANAFLAHDYILTPDPDSDMVRWNNTFAVTPGGGVAGALAVGLEGPEFLPGGDFSVVGYLEGPQGSLGEDLVDFYAFPAMPGDVITFGQSAGPTLFAVGLFNPAGDLVATSGYLAPTETYVIDYPGLWRVAVATDADFEAASATSSGPYVLTVTGAMQTAMGAYTGGQAYGVDINVALGAAGGMEIAGNVYGTTTDDGSSPIIFPGFTDVGLTVISADGIVQIRASGDLGGSAPWGEWQPVVAHSAIDLQLGAVFAPAAGLASLPQRPVGGPVGLFQAGTSWMGGGIYADGGIFNDFDIHYVLSPNNIGWSADGATKAIEGFDIVADGNISSIVTGGDYSPTSYTRANSDNFGPQIHGQIDLLDIGGDFGNLEEGHPEINVGVGGNVRFARVAGDIYYAGPGISTLDPVVLGTGVPGPHIFTDDSGGQIILPEPETGTVTYRYIPVTSGGPGTVMTLLDIVSDEYSVIINGEAEIGEVNITLTGAPAVPGAPGAPGAPGGPGGSTFAFGGPGELDIYYLTGSLDDFLNTTTDGDLVHAVLGSANSIVLSGEGGDLGFAEHIGTVNPATGYINGPPVYVGVPAGIVGIKNTPPLRGVNVGGDLLEVRAAGAIGDVIASGYIGTVRSDTDNTNSADLSDPWYAGIGDGLVGVIYGTGADPTDGFAVVDVNVGPGMAPAGTGLDAKAGVFSPAVVGSVRSTRPGVDFVQPAITGTGGIYLVETTNGGSILGGKITVDTIDTLGGWQVFDGSYLTGAPIGTVGVRGAGAVIDGTQILANTVRNVMATRGADGIFNSFIWSSGVVASPPTWAISRGINRIEASGFGIHGTTVQSEGNVNRMVATDRTVGEFANNSVDINGGSLGLLQAPTVRDSYVNVRMSLDNLRGGTFTNTEVHAGEVGRVQFTNDIEGQFFVSGPFDYINSQRGDLNTDILLMGENGYLGRAMSAGPIRGTIDAQGGINMLMSRTGGLEGEVISGADVNTIRMALGITGDVHIAGDCRMLMLGGDLGSGSGVFFVGGDLGTARIGTRAPADINNDVIIGGGVRMLRVTGGVYGNFYSGGPVQNFSVDGPFVTTPNHIAVAGRLDTSADVDFYSFTATAGESVTLETDTVGDGVLGTLVRVPDTVLAVWRTGDPFFGFINDDHFMAGGTDSWIQFNAPATDTYIVAVTHWPDGLFADPVDGWPAGNVGPYTLSIDGADTESAWIDSEAIGTPNNTFGTAQDLSGRDEIAFGSDVGRWAVGSRTRQSVFGDVYVFGNFGTGRITGDLNGSMFVEGNLRGLDVATMDLVVGQLGRPGLGDVFEVHGTAGRLNVGSPRVVADLNSDVVVWGDFQSARVSGDAPGDWDIGGTLRGAQVTGTLGQSGFATHFNVGGDARLTVGSRTAVSPVFTDVNVGGQARLNSTGDWGEAGNVLNAGSLSGLTVGGRGLPSDLVSDVTVTNDARSVQLFDTLVGNMTIGGNLTRLAAGPIWGNIHVVGDTQSVTTTSTVLPGIFPIDFLFDNGLDPTGSLRCDGTIRSVRGA